MFHAKGTRLTSTYLNHRRVRRIQPGRVVHRPQQLLLRQPVGHGDAVAPAAVVARRPAYDGVDGVAVTDGVFHTLNEQARRALAPAEPGGLGIV